MDVLLCFDHKFVMPYGVMLKSLIENNLEEPIHCHAMIDESVSEDDKNNLRNSIGVEGNNDITFYLIHDEVLRLFPKPINRKYTKMTFSRLLATSLLPEHIDKLLYLDGDVIVRKPIHELWNTDISSFAMAGVLDINQSCENYYRMHLKYSQGYVNTGVFLINMKWWRDNNIQTKFIDFINSSSPEQLKYCDQDVLNYVLQDKKLLLPIKYNTMSGFLGDMSHSSFPFYDYESEVIEAINDPVIIHFTGRLRPWHKGCRHPLRAEFEKYYRQTRWADIPFKRKEESFKWYLRNIIVSIFKLFIHE